MDKLLFLYFLICSFAEILCQQCGVPKAFDTMSLKQQFRSTRRNTRETHWFIDSFTKPELQAEGIAPKSRRFPKFPWSDKQRAVANRIVGGYDTIDNTGGQLCWQVGIVIGAFRGYYNCGGTIVGTRTIVTAAHCVLNWRGSVRSPAEFTVMVGALSGAFNGTESVHGAAGCARSLKVSRVIKHDNYNPDNSDNDIAILILDGELDFSKRCICPACLTEKQPQANEFCITSGYGNEVESGVGNRQAIPLKWVYLNVMQQNKVDCSVNGDTNLDLFICAGNVKGQDSCQGDSGGPLVCWDNDKAMYYLAGVVSFGDGCGRGKTGGQYTKVARYLSWIRSSSLFDAKSFL